MEKKEESSFLPVASFYSFPVEQKYWKILNFVFHWICKYVLKNTGKWAYLGVVEWEAGYTSFCTWLNKVSEKARQPGGWERVSWSHAGILRSDCFQRHWTSLESLILRVSPNSAQYLVNTDASLWNMLILFFHFYTISRTFLSNTILFQVLLRSSFF